MKYSNTAITQLTRLYKSILVKCAIFNAAILMSSAFVATPAMADHTVITDNASLSGTYQGSTANDDGGVFFVNAEGKTVEIKSSKFTGNSVTGVYATGGAISLKRGTLNIDNTVFTGNTAPYSGAIFTYSSGNKLKITNSQFNSNEALGAGALQAMFETEIKDTSFTGNRATEDSDGAGALFVGAVGKTKLDNVTFANNTSATRGGAISTRAADLADNSEAKIDILGSTFTGNTAGTTGGAIDNYMYSSVKDATAVYIDDTTFTNNTANKGGAIYNHGQTDKAGKTSSLKIVNSTFTGNGVDATSGDVVAQYGGAIYNEAHASMSIEGTFTGNKAVRGGAVYNEGEITLNNSIFTGNSSTGNSGAIAQHDVNSVLTLNNTQFNSNSADWGGAIVARGTVNITGGSFKENHSNDGGGAIYLATLANKGHKLSIDGTTFTGNYTTAAADGSDGGGAIGSFSDLTVSNATFTNNSVTGSNSNGGGAIMMGSVSTNDIQSSTFTGNTSDTNGGAIATRFAVNSNNSKNNNSGAKLDITGTSFESNSAEKGGAIYNTFYNDDENSGYVTVSNSSFTSNSAEKGGAVYNDGTKDTTGKSGAIKVLDTNFTNNTASALGGAIYNESELIVAANTADVMFSGNTANGAANDIYNAGTLTLNAASGKTISLEGGIDGDSANKGTVNVAGDVEVSTIKNQTVAHNSGELHITNGAADGSNLSGSTVTVANGAVINTIDNVINDYSESINLADGAKVKGDVDFEKGVADKYAATSGTIKYMVANLIGAAANGSKTIQVAGEGSTINISEAKFNIENGLTFETSGSADGKMIVNGMSGGIEDAADASGNVENVDYDFKADESVDNNKEFHHTVTVNGNGTSVLTLNADLGTAAGANTTYNKMNFAGAGALNNNGTLHINNSNVGVNVNNYGRLISDPTTYTGKVTNAAGAYASFEGDTFTGTAELANSGDVYLEKDALGNSVTFDAGAKITGNGDLYLMSGTTAFDNTKNSNDAYLASGAKFSGTLIGGSLNTQNGAIDTGLGTIKDANLYMDAKLSGTGSADAFTGTDGSTIKEITILGNDYNPTKDELKIAVGNATLDDDVVINGANYYTSITKDTEGNLVFSDKLINTSTLRGTGDGSLTFVGDVVIGDKADTTTIGTDSGFVETDNTYEFARMVSVDNDDDTRLAKVTVTGDDYLTNDVTATLYAQDTAARKVQLEANATYQTIVAAAANGFIISNGATTPATATLSVSTVTGVGDVLDIDADSVTSKEFRADTSLVVEDTSHNELFVADANGIEVKNSSNKKTFDLDAASGQITMGNAAGSKFATLSVGTNGGLNVAEGLTVGSGTYGISSTGAASVASLAMANNASTPGTSVMTTVDDGNFGDTSATTFATNATVNKAKTDVETKLTAGASGYDINAKTLKVQGSDVLSTANVAPNYTYDSSKTIADVTTYVSTNASKFANVASTAGLIETVMSDKEDWIGRELGYDPKTTDANTVLSGEGFTDKDSSGKVSFNDAVVQLKDDITVTVAGNYIAAGENVAGNLGNLDTGLHDVATIVGPAQTTAATTGQFVGRKIGADINLVNAVDELGRNMVSLGAENVFTRLNTFKNDGGIALQDSAGGNSTRLKATTDGLSVDRNVEATGFKIAGQAPVVTSIDTDGTTVTSAATAANVMATSATVYNGAEKGQYTGAKVNGDTATTHTINSALAKTNTTLNGILTTAGTEVDSTKVDVQWNSTDSTLATVLGNGVYSSTNNVAAGDSVTTAIGKLDSALKTAADTIGAGAITATTGTAGTLVGKTIGDGTSGSITVTQALANLDATNKNQNSGLNSLAGLINGGSVDASTGAYTAGSATLNTGSGVGQFAATNLTAAANELMSDITVATGTYNYISQGSNVGSNLIALDTQVKNVTDKVAVVGTPEAAAVTDGGILNGKAITGDSSVSGHMTLVEAVRYMSKKAAGLDLNNTFTGNNTFNGTVKIGSANAISSTTAGELNMGNNELTNVAGLTLVNGSADVALNADTSGNLVVDSGVIAKSLGIGTAGTEFTVDTSGNTKTGTLQIGAANAITGTASSLNMGANALTNIASIATTGNATIGGDLGVTGTSNLHNTNVQGNLTIKNADDPSKSVAMDVRRITVGSDNHDVVQVNGGLLSTDVIASTNGFKVLNSTSADKYTEVFDIDDHGSITSDVFSTNNTAAGNTVTIGKADNSTATTVKGTLKVTGATQLDSTLTADGESKFGKDTSDVYSLDVTNSAVTANKVVEATAGVKFGTDTTAMTGVSRANLSSVVDHTTNDSVIASAAAVQETRKDIEDKAHAVLGDVYKIDSTTRVVSYDNTALEATKPNGFETGATDLTDALTKYADNVMAAMGTTYAANGTYTNGFAKPAAVNYDGLATNQTLVAAISQLDKNIGTAITGTDRSGTAFDTSATNTVNENIAALDAAIGADVTKEYNGVVKTNSINQNIDAISTTLGRMDNLSTEAKTAGSDVVTRGNLTNANNTPLTADLTVADALSNLDKTLGRIHGLYDGTTVNVTDPAYPSVTGANSNLAKGTTVENHLVSLDNAIGSRNIASLNADINKAVNGDATATAGTEAYNGSLALGLQSVGDQMGDMDFTSTHYVAAGDNLSGAVRTLDSNLYRVEEDLRDLRRDFNNGMASMSAMSALVPNPRAAGNTSLSVGTGAYNGRTAVAVGGFHHINDNIMLNAGAAWGNASDVAYRLGITWSW